MTGGFAGNERFTVVRALGAGGMGEVIEVEDRVRGERVAVKVMRTRASGPEALLRFKREFRLAAELRHPNLVRLHELFADDALWYFTMELVRGSDLASATVWEDRTTGGEEAMDSTLAAGAALAMPAAPRGVSVVVRTEPVVPACDLDRLQALLPQVVDALDALHSRGIAHRDLKPSNVLVTAEGIVKLADFGIARSARDEGAATAGGGILGTAAYMSPEQAAGREIGPASDIYSLGVMIYELLAGEPPFRGNVLEVMDAHRTRDPRALAEVVEGVPASLVALCARMLAKEPRARPSLAEIRATAGPGDGPVPEARKSDERPEVFVGRARELSELSGALSQTGTGVRLVVVRGRSGEGKSALLEQLAAHLGDSGTRVLRGRCYEREAVPFLAFDRLVDQLALRLRSWPVAFRRSVVPELLAASRVFPVVALALPREVRPPSRQLDDDPREGRRLAFRGVIELLRRLGELEPVLLVIDDLQWVDGESIELLDAIVAEPHLALGLACAARTEDLSDAHPFERWLAERARAPGGGAVHVLDLAPLGETEVAELIARATGSRASPEVVSHLREQTGGHALFLVEQAASLARGEKETAHSSLSVLLAQRLATLSPRGRELTSLAAAAGGACTPRLLTKASTLDREHVHQAIDELVDHGILRRARREVSGRSALEPWFDFRHDKLREAAYAALRDGARPKVHRALGLALEDDSFAAWPGRLEALVRHFDEAGDETRTARYLELAAQDASEKLAFGRACVLWERRIALARDPAERARASWRLVELRDHACDYAGCARAYGQAADAHASAGDARAEIRARLHEGNVLVRTGRLEEGTATFERALRPLGLRLERSTTSRLVVLFGLWVRWLLARVWGQKRPVTDDDRLALEVTWYVLQAFMLPQALAAAEHVLRGRLLGERTSGSTSEFVAALADVLVHAQRAPSPQRSRVIARALARLELCAPEARREGLQGADILPATFRAFAAAAGEDWNLALDALHRVLERHRETPNLWAARTTQSLLAVLGCFAGWDEEAERLARELLALGTRDVGLASSGGWVLAGAHSRRGELAELERILDAWAPLVPERPVNRLALWRDIGRIHVPLLRGEHRRVLDLYERWSPAYRRAGQLLDVGNEAGWAYAPLVAAVRLARTRRLLPAERRCYLRLTRRLARRAAPPFRSLFRTFEAELLGCSGRDPTQALADALARSSRHPMPFERWLCLRAAKRLGKSTPELDAERAQLEARHRYRYDDVASEKA